MPRQSFTMWDATRYNNIPKFVTPETLEEIEKINSDPEGDDWMENGECNKYDPDLWFPEKESSKEGNRAISICRTCPVQLKCLEYAIRNDIRYGIWGAIKTSERMRIKNKIRPLNHQKPSIPSVQWKDLPKEKINLKVGDSFSVSQV